MPKEPAVLLPYAASAPFRSGRYYDQSHAMPVTNTGTGGMAANVLYAAPLYVPNAVRLDRVGARITGAATAGKLIRLGIYAKAAASNVPGALLVDGGAGLPADVTGMAEHAISLPVAAGTLLWLAVISDGTPTLNSWPTTTRFSLDGFSDITTDPGFGYSAVQAYGALPSTFPTPTNTAGSFRVFARVA